MLWALSSFWWCCSATTAEAVPETETWAGNAIIAAAAVQGKSAFWMISIIAENMEDTADRVKIPDSLSWGFFNAGLKAIKPCRILRRRKALSKKGLGKRKLRVSCGNCKRPLLNGIRSCGAAVYQNSVLSGAFESRKIKNAGFSAAR